MIEIRLTERTITRTWDKQAQEQVERIIDTTILLNPEQIVFVRGDTDAPEKYSSHVRTVGNWDLFVVEDLETIAVKLKEARDQGRWDIEAAIAAGIVDSR